MSEGRTELEKLGEFNLINHLTKKFIPKNKSTVLGIGDDAAIISMSNNKVKLVSTDLMIEGIHFDLTYMPLKHLGYKAVVINISDILAMNGTAEQITVSIAVSNRFPVEALEELYDGIHKACSIYNIDLVGGDTTSSLSGLSISITVIGTAEKKDVVSRSGAKENDLIITTGDLGAAYMGLQILEREKSIYNTNPKIQPDLDGHDYIIGRQLKPEARNDIILDLKKMNVKPTSMIDISDGLASEIIHLCKSSNVGCNVYDEKIPIDSKTSMTAIDFNLDPTTCALNGGEDYELLFTINQSDFEKVKGNPNMTIIGHITNPNDGIYFIDKSGNQIELKAQGWNHFNE